MIFKTIYQSNNNPIILYPRNYKKKITNKSNVLYKPKMHSKKEKIGSRKELFA